MKKRLFLFCMILALVFACAACKGPAEHPIKTLRGELEAAENYQMVFEFTEVPELGSFTATVKIDGDKTYTEDSLGTVKQYTERADDILYLYTQSEGGWQKQELSAQDDNAYISEKDFDTLFGENNYVLAEGTDQSYFMIDSVSLDGLEGVALTVTDDGCIITATVRQNGLSMQAKITVKEIGTTTVTLPEIEKP